MKHIAILTDEEYEILRKEKQNPVINITTEYLQKQVEILDEFVKMKSDNYNILHQILNRNHIIWCDKIKTYINQKDITPKNDKEKEKEKSKKQTKKRLAVR